MKIKKFRIRNFRSIADTGWHDMCPDGVTVLVGQNESGKSSVLDAIALTSSERELTGDDIRYGAEWPSVEIEYAVDRGGLDDDLDGFEPVQLERLNDYLEECGRLICKYSWTKGEQGQFNLRFDIEDLGLLNVLSSAMPVDNTEGAD